MDGSRTVFPDIIAARLEDLYGAPLPDEEFPLHLEAIRNKAAQLPGLMREDAREEAREIMQELESLGERVRRVSMRFAYLQGLQDGDTVREAMTRKNG